MKLIGITRNKVARELVSSNTERENQNLIEDLSSMKPYQAKVAASIYQASNCALRNRMIGRFTSASSVIQLVRNDKNLAALYEETNKQDILH